MTGLRALCLGLCLGFAGSPALAQDARPAWQIAADAIVEALNAGRLNDAARLADQAIAALPADAPPEAISTTYCDAGAVHQQRDDGDRALALFAEGISRLGDRHSELATSDVCLFHGSAQVLALRGDHERTMAFLRRAGETYVNAERREQPQGVILSGFMLTTSVADIGRIPPAWHQLMDRMYYATSHLEGPVPLQPLVVPVDDVQLDRQVANAVIYWKVTLDNKMRDLGGRIAVLASRREALPPGDPGRATIQAQIDAVAYELNDTTLFQGRTLAQEKRMPEAYRYLAIGLRDHMFHRYIETVTTMQLRQNFLEEATRRNDSLHRIDALTSLYLTIADRAARAAVAGSEADLDIMKSVSESVVDNTWALAR